MFEDHWRIQCLEFRSQKVAIKAFLKSYDFGENAEELMFQNIHNFDKTILLHEK